MPDKMPVLREPVRKRRGGKKLLAVLFILFIVILSVLFFNSSISKISSVHRGRTRILEAANIQKAAGVPVGDAFFGTMAKTIEARVGKLKAIETADVIKSFPGKIKIVVQEFPTIAFELSPRGDFIRHDVEWNKPLAGHDIVVDKPILSGWKTAIPVKIELCKAAGGFSGSSLSDFSEILPAASASYKDRIKIYTRTRFEVITAVSLAAGQDNMLNAVIETQEPGMITLLLADKYAPLIPSDSENRKPNQKETTQ